MFLNRQLLFLRHDVRHLWCWGACLALSCLVLLAWFFVLPRLRDQNDVWQRRTQTLTIQAAASIVAAPADTSLGLPAQLPSFDRLSKVSDDLQALVGQNGLTLSDATFKPLGELANGQVGRMEIGAHLKGTYPPLKKTIAALLASHEGLAMSSFSVRRARATDTIVDVDLRFTFFFRKQV